MLTIDRWKTKFGGQLSLTWVLSSATCDPASCSKRSDLRRHVARKLAEARPLVGVALTIPVLVIALRALVLRLGV
jgi:hypothetical protein